MNKVRRRLVPTILACLLTASLGCGGGKGSAPVVVGRTPVQYFRERQDTTVTPHGKIRMDTVAEQGGKIQYQTEDGRKWCVSYSKQADGTYQYGTPEEVK